MMKSKIFVMAIVNIVMFACSKEDGRIAEFSEKGIVFKLAIVNELNTAPNTKVRAIYSQEALQEVTRVSIYAFRESGADFVYAKTYGVTGWTAGTDTMTYSVAANDTLSAGNYKFLAVGREATDNFMLPTLIAGTTTIEQLIASVTDPGQASEIFAGIQNVTISSVGVRVAIQMTRRVAGVLLYVKNVPATLGGEAVQSIRLSATDAGTAVKLSDGTVTTATGTAYTVFNVNLTGQTITGNGVYAGNDLAGLATKVANSQLFGQFLLPVSGVTLTLGLYGATNNLLKSWTIQEGSNTTFNIEGNHFYSIGKKMSKDDTTGGTTGPADAPIDLLLDQAITVSIDPVWSVVHDLTLQ